MSRLLLPHAALPSSNQLVGRDDDAVQPNPGDVVECVELAELRETCRRIESEKQELANRVRSLDRQLDVYRFLDPLGLGRKLRPWLFDTQQHSPRPFKIPADYQTVRLHEPAPAISIVTPSYNQAQFLERTIRSVLDQRYPRLEYIVQDGGSSDGSDAIIARHNAQLAFWESARDGGQSNAINRGMGRATGEILAYLNSDDVLLPGSLAYVANIFARRPDVDLIYGHRVIIDANDMEVGRWVLPPHDDELLSWVDFVPQETMFWRRRIWEKVGSAVDESFDFAMDWDLLLRFRAAGAKMYRAPRFLGAFRATPQQKSNTMVDNVGRREVRLLKERSLGYQPDGVEWDRRLRPYLARHVVLRLLYRLGILRY